MIKMLFNKIELDKKEQEEVELLINETKGKKKKKIQIRIRKMMIKMGNIQIKKSLKIIIKKEILKKKLMKAINYLMKMMNLNISSNYLISKYLKKFSIN